jgi:homoserine acetyltransferase
MGSMQGFELIAEYPELADKAILYVCSPRNSSYDKMRHKISLDIIELGRKYDISPQEYMRSVNLIQNMNGKSPEYFSLEMSHDQAEDYIAKFDSYKPALFTQDNFYSQTKALYYNDISWRDEYNIKKTAQRIKTDLFIIVNKQDHTVSPWEALKFAEMTNAKTLLLDNNRGHLGITHEMARVRKAMDKFLKKRIKNQ